jgi:hypothetical protein
VAVGFGAAVGAAKAARLGIATFGFRSTSAAAAFAGMGRAPWSLGRVAKNTMAVAMNRNRRTASDRLKPARL